LKKFLTKNRDQTPFPIAADPSAMSDPDQQPQQLAHDGVDEEKAVSDEHKQTAEQ